MLWTLMTRWETFKSTLQPPPSILLKGKRM